MRDTNTAKQLLCSYEIKVEYSRKDQMIQQCFILHHFIESVNYNMWHEDNTREQLGIIMK